MTPTYCSRFDAFLTLKIIHALRDDHLPNISYDRLKKSQIFKTLLEHDRDLSLFQQKLHKVIR